MFVPRDPKNVAERLMFLAGSSRSKDVAEWAGLPYNTVNNYINTGRMPSAEALIKIHENRGVNIQWLLTGFGEPYTGEVEPAEVTTPGEEIEEDISATPAPRVRETPGEMVIHIPAFEIRVTHTGGGEASPASVKKVLVPLIKAALSKEE